MRFRTKDANSFGIGGKIIGTLFLGAFLAGGIFFFSLLSKEIWQTVQTYQWTPTECRILTSEVVRANTRDDSPYEFRVTFEYDWNGRTYQTETPHIKPQTYSSFNQAQELANKFPAEIKASCWVNPDQPTQAILVRGSWIMVPFLIIPIVFIVIGGGGIIVVWTMKSTGEGEDGPISEGAISEKAEKKTGAGCLILFFAIFLLMGSGFFYGFFIRPALQIMDAQDWIETPCVVESSDVQSHRGDDSTTYRVDILYRYTVDGKEFKSSQYHFMGGSSSGYKGKREIVRQYPAGKQTVCYVNPENPSQAVLVRGWTATMWAGLIPLVFVLVGLGGIIFAIRRSRMAVSATSGSRSMGSSPLPSPSAATSGMLARGSGLPDPMSDGATELKPRHSPLGKLMGMILFAAFWNGIVSVFVWQVIQGWQKGGRGGGFMEKWFLPVFLIPFVLIGLFLIVAMVSQFLALFNARPRLRVSSQSVCLGDSFDLEWRLDGRIAPVERLQIFLEGKEEATYRHGTNTHTDRHVFATFELMNSSARSEMLSGSTRFTLPEDTMHSFESGSNKIIWTLHVKGAIRRWPDIDEEFAMQVLPQKVNAS